jgi:hypothetical protein
VEDPFSREHRFSFMEKLLKMPVWQGILSGVGKLRLPGRGITLTKQLFL